MSYTRRHRSDFEAGDFMALAGSRRLALIMTLAFMTIGSTAQQEDHRDRSNDLSAAHPQIEIATVKPTAPNTTDKMFAVTGEHRLVIVNRSLRNILAISNNMQEDQIVGGPKWVGSEPFDITALAPQSLQIPTFDQWKSMLQPLLVERFGLKLHDGTKTLPAYILTSRDNGARLTTSRLSPSALPDVTITGPGHLRVTNATLHDVLVTLECCVLRRPIIDKTQLTGRYDFELDWNPKDLVADSEQEGRYHVSDLPSLFTALRETIGLEVKAVKAVVAVISVDEAQSPSPN